MMCSRLVLATGIVVLAGSTACTSDQAQPTGPAVSGWYEVTHHSFGAGDCVLEGADATGLSVIRLTEEQYNGTDYLALRRCQDMEPDTCDDEDFFHGTSFIVPMVNGWQELEASAAYQPLSEECYLSYGVATLLKNGDGVIIELRRYEELEPGVAADDCTYERAMERADTMACLDFEVIHGQPPLD